jgi:hypothetical protein
MPHVRAREYIVPPEEYELVYVEVIQRHHKVKYSLTVVITDRLLADALLVKRFLAGRHHGTLPLGSASWG